jgi:hypothetical protein
MLLEGLHFSWSTGSYLISTPNSLFTVLKQSCCNNNTTPVERVDRAPNKEGAQTEQQHNFLGV